MIIQMKVYKRKFSSLLPFNKRGSGSTKSLTFKNIRVSQSKIWFTIPVPIYVVRLLNKKWLEYRNNCRAVKGLINC